MLSALVALGITWLGGLILQTIIVGRLIAQEPRFTFWKNLEPSDWLSMVFMWLRMVSLFIEQGFWTRWLTEFAQQRWAASFYLSEQAKEILGSHHPPSLTTLPTHIPSFVLGAVLLCCWPFVQQPWMVTFGGCLIVEPIVRMVCQMLFRRRSMAIWTFSRSEEGETWMIRVGSAFLFFLFGAFCIRYGTYYYMYWMIWLGGGFWFAYLVWLWIDSSNGYTRRFVRWSQSKRVENDREVEFEYLD